MCVGCCVRACGGVCVCVCVCVQDVALCLQHKLLRVKSPQFSVDVRRMSHTRCCCEVDTGRLYQFSSLLKWVDLCGHISALFLCFLKWRVGGPLTFSVVVLFSQTVGELRQSKLGGKLDTVHRPSAEVQMVQEKRGLSLSQFITSVCEAKFQQPPLQS